MTPVFQVPLSQARTGGLLVADARCVRQEPDITFTTLSDPQAFEALGREWSSLFAASGKPHQVFQTFEWLSIWASLYLDKRTRLSIVTGRIDRRLVMVWPLIVRHVVGLRVMSCMGEPLSQYSDALIADGLGEAAEDAALAYVAALPVDVIAFRRVRDDAAIAPLLRRRLGAPSNVQEAPFVTFGTVRTPRAFEASFSGKLRSSRRRRRRRLDERGQVSFTRYGPSPEAAALVALALDFKRAWAQQSGAVAPAIRDPRFERFFQAAALAGAKAPDLQVSALRCGTEILGVEISVACKGTLFGHVLAPHPGFGQLGLGGILAELIITNALEHGYDGVDLLAPADPHKLEWTTTSVGVGDYSVAKTMRGALYAHYWVRHGRVVAKAIAKRLSPGLAILSRCRKGP